MITKTDREQAIKMLIHMKRWEPILGESRQALDMGIEAIEQVGKLEEELKKMNDDFSIQHRDNLYKIFGLERALEKIAKYYEQETNNPNEHFAYNIAKQALGLK